MTTPMRFHVPGLPWTRTNGEHTTCAYTQKVVKFGRMMTRRGHEVYVYSGVDNEAECTGHAVVITPEEQAPILGTHDAPWDNRLPVWMGFNTRTAVEIARRQEPGDFLCLITPAQMPVARALPEMPAVEFGIGYHHTEAGYRVFESEAWRHTVYGAQGGSNRDGRWYDAVVPNYFDPDDFEVGDPAQSGSPYFLFMGRGIRRKGTQIASDVARHLGERLVLAGADPWGEMGDYGEKVGPVGPAMRRHLLARATALFVPTLYVEPFGGVAVEALMSGCPVITTDYGAFTETVDVDAGDGWRCSTMAEFVDAARAAVAERESPERGVARIERRRRAIERFGLDAIAPRYERFFERVAELYRGEGWPAMEHPPAG